ncbi:MAG: metallophosphoesterase [Nitrospirae bacterium]|nr:metallophosphoesterase [Nitrospirota bacterium]
MAIFLVSFILIYGGIHLYAFLKVKAALLPGKMAQRLTAFFLIAMISAPFFVRLYEKNGLETFAYLTAHVGFIWMGIIFLFFIYGVLIDFWRFLIFTAGIVLKKNFLALRPSPKFAFFIPLIISMAVTSYGYFEAMDVKTERLTISSAKIPPEAGRIKIVQISDVHLGHIVREARLKNILDKVKTEKPDIFISTGDLVDGQRSELNALSNLFREINPRYGKFAITGNHEYYAGLEQSLEFTEKAGFRILRGEGLTVGIINIAGVDDQAGISSGTTKSVNEKEMLSRLPKDKFTLFLKHRPLIVEDLNGLFDLQLSGHAHKGQIFPFNFFVGRFFPFISGYHKITDKSSIYISRGSGTWGPPIRFLSQPEVTVIELVNK